MRQYFICHATTTIPPQVVHAATGSDLVYHKNYEHGMLYSLYYKHEHRKQNGTVENSIDRLDSILMTKNGTSRTNFTSLTEFGKVKSFSGRDRNDDYHFRQIFQVDAPKLDNGKRYQLHPGVDTWSPGIIESSSEAGFDEVVSKLKDTTTSGDPIVEESIDLGEEIDALEVELDQNKTQLEERDVEIARQVGAF